MITSILKTITAVAVVMAASTAAWAQDYPRMNLRLAHAFPATWAQTKVDQWWADEIRKRSGDKIRINIMWAGSGGNPMEILKLVGSGAVDMGAVPPSYFPSQLPLSGAPNALPLTFTTNEEASEVMEGLVKNVPAIQEELKRNNVWPLYFQTLNTYQPLCTKPLATLDDFKGLRIRSFGAYQPALWESLGAIGVTVLPAEIYEGLQKGRLDCGFYSTDLYVATKLYEVAKHLSTLGFGPQPTWPIWVNHEKWSKYPENVKKLISEVSDEARVRGLKAVKEARESSLQQMKEFGVSVVQFKDEEALLKQAPKFRKVWLEAMQKEGKGKEAQEVLDYWNKHGKTK